MAQHLRVFRHIGFLVSCWRIAMATNFKREAFRRSTTEWLACLGVSSDLTVREYARNIWKVDV